MYHPFVLINMGKILQFYLDDNANNSLFDFYLKDTSIKENKFITPTIMKRVLYIRALKNKVRSYISKSLWKDF